MIQSVVLLAFLLCPVAVVHAHGCPAFTINDTISRGIYLSMEDKFFPADLKSIINGYDDNSTVFTGVYDCHSEEDGNEVGMAAICDPDDGCTCVAMYNFEVCRRCDLECFDDDAVSDGNITIKSYAADCGNVKGGLTEECVVGCGFETSGCLASEAQVSPNPPMVNGTDGGMTPPPPGGMNDTDVTTTSTPPPKGGGGNNTTKDDKDDGGDDGMTSPSAVPVDGATTTTPPPAPDKGGSSNTTKDDGEDDMETNTTTSSAPVAMPTELVMNGTGVAPTFPPVTRPPRSSPPVKAPTTSSTIGASNTTSAAIITTTSYYRCVIGAVVSAVGLWM